MTKEGCSLLDVNNFEYMKIGLASPDKDPLVVPRRSEEAGNDQLSEH